MRRARLSLAFGLLAITATLHADTRPSVERQVAHLLNGSIRLAAQLNDGRLPTNWLQLDFKYDYWNQALAENGVGTIQSTYIFVSTDLPMIGQEEGRVVLARYKPLKEGSGEGRYVVLLGHNGDFISTWVDENKFQNMLARAGVTLPEPDPAAVRAAEVGLKRAADEREEMFRAMEETTRQLAQEEAAQQRILERPPRSSTLLGTQGMTSVAVPDPSASTEPPTTFLLQWIGIGLAGLLGIGLVIVLLRGSNRQ